MKNILLFVFILSCNILARPSYAQLEGEMYLGFSIPQRQMAQDINNAGGIGIKGLYTLPKSPKIAVGVEINMFTYGFQSTPQTYIFADSSTTQTTVDISNNFANYNALIQYTFTSITKGRLNIKPYVSGKIGYSSYWTDLSIADPQDEDGCKPLESNVLFKDGAWFFAGGIGVKTRITDNMYLNISSNYTVGGSVRYMNVNIASTSPMHEHDESGRRGVEPYNARFINPATQVVHEHHVGDLYKNPIQSLDIRIGVGFIFN